jgi:uncharacterized protein YbjT (DUF2867 family)
MSQPILVTGAAGGQQGSTGNRVVQLLTQSGLPVRALVHQVDERSERLQTLGAEVLAGDLLDPHLVRRAMQGIERAYFTYPVADGLLEATAIFAMAAREASTELVVNMSQLQSTPVAPSFRNLQHRLADQIFDWAQVGAVHLNAPPFFENVRALIARTVADQNTIFLPWGHGDAVIPLVAGEDCARVAAALLQASHAPDQKRYDLVGETPTVNEIVSILSAVLNRPIQYVDIPDERWIEAVKDRVNRHAVEHLSSLWRFFRTSGIRKGESGFRVSEAIECLTGVGPQTLEQFFRMNVESFGVIAESSPNRTRRTQG